MDEDLGISMSAREEGQEGRKKRKKSGAQANKQSKAEKTLRVGGARAGSGDPPILTGAREIRTWNPAGGKFKRVVLCSNCKTCSD